MYTKRKKYENIEIYHIYDSKNNWLVYNISLPKETDISSVVLEIKNLNSSNEILFIKNIKMQENNCIYNQRKCN